MNTEEILAHINGQFTEIKALGTRSAEQATETQSRLTAVEQQVVSIKSARGGGSHRPASWGTQIAEADRLKAFVADGMRGSARIPIKASITVPSGMEQRDLVAPQFDGIQGLPQQALTVRNLIGSVKTESNLIKFVRQISRTNNAAPVADGAQKPESDLGFEMAEAPVRTIAHWVPCPRQTLEDVTGLAALIDSELTFGLKLVEEEQILLGDGSGENLLGIVPQAQPFNVPFAVTDENPLDRVLLAIVQAQQSRLPVDAVVVNDITWAQLISLKDSEGRYLAGGNGGPFGSLPGLLWQVRVVPTPTLERGECLVGSFRLAARLHDRLETEILVSSEDRDNFIKNMVTIRAEERTALTVRVPDAFVFVDDLGVSLLS